MDKGIGNRSTLYLNHDYKGKGFSSTVCAYAEKKRNLKNSSFFAS